MQVYQSFTKDYVEVCSLSTLRDLVDSGHNVEGFSYSQKELHLIKCRMESLMKEAAYIWDKANRLESEPDDACMVGRLSQIGVF
jgi:hypothetical protein